MNVEEHQTAEAGAAEVAKDPYRLVNTRNYRGSSGYSQKRCLTGAGAARLADMAGSYNTIAHGQEGPKRIPLIIARNKTAKSRVKACQADSEPPELANESQLAESFARPEPKCERVQEESSHYDTTLLLPTQDKPVHTREFYQLPVQNFDLNALQTAKDLESRAT